MAPLPDEGSLRKELPLPELSELDVVRHFVRLSQRNMSIDTTFYPLGSCTMKYNPKVNEKTAALPGFTNLHPLQDEEMVQGAMQLMFELQVYLAQITGFDAVALQPAAGAHGELTGVLIMRKYQIDRGQTQRTKILVPDSAHGTNPATTTMSGLQVVELPSDGRGNVDLEALKANLDDTVVGLMLTNPNTLGLFEEHVLEVTRLVHEAGGLVYGDGANLNAIVGIAKPAELGFDVMHFNLHKTFSTPHGGGGPGAGPVGVVEKLAPFLPGPLVAVRARRRRVRTSTWATLEDEDHDEGYQLAWYTPSKSIGRVRSYFGNFGVLVRAYTYIRMHGPEGLRRIAENAVLNANYLKARLQAEGSYPGGVRRADVHARVRGPGHPGRRARSPHHGHRQAADGLRLPPADSLLPADRQRSVDDRADRDREQGHAGRLRRCADQDRAGGAVADPELLKTAPHNAPVKRLDEVRAARDLILCRC